MQQGSLEWFIGRKKKKGQKREQGRGRGGQRLVHGDKSGRRERQRENEKETERQEVGKAHLV